MMHSYDIWHWREGDIALVYWRSQRQHFAVRLRKIHWHPKNGPSCAEIVNSDGIVYGVVPLATLRSDPELTLRDAAGEPMENP